MIKVMVMMGLLCSIDVRATGLEVSEQTLKVVAGVSGTISIVTGALSAFTGATSLHIIGKDHGHGPLGLDDAVVAFFSVVFGGCSAVTGTIAYLAGSRACKN